MNMEIFTVFDQAAKSYLEPFFTPTIEAALRVFKEACTREGHQFQKFPEDYVLFHVGSWDGKEGMVTPGTMPVKIAMALDYFQYGTLEDLKNA